MDTQKHTVRGKVCMQCFLALHVTVTQTGCIAYLWTAGAVSAEIKQFGLAVGDQGAGSGAHA